MAQITETGTIDLKAQKAARDDAAKTATNYIEADTDGIKIFDSSTSKAAGTYQHQTATETEFYVGGESMAEFGGSGARIGKAYDSNATDNESHMELDYHSMQLIDKDGDTYFHVSDLRDDTGYATLTETFVGDGTTKTFKVSRVPTTAVSATDSSNPSNTASRSGSNYTFASAPADAATVTIVYKTNEKVYARTFGSRRSNSNPGNASSAEGYAVEASGAYSHAEGNSTKATKLAAHAEGDYTTASASDAHAEGYFSTASGFASHAEGASTESAGEYSHAEGSNTSASGAQAHAEGEWTVASGIDSHAEGAYTEATDDMSHAEGFETEASGYASHAEGEGTHATGTRSHAQNNGTRAQYADQTAIGRSNDNQSDNAFEIGNGTGSAPSNAFAVDWNGNVEAEGFFNGIGVSCDASWTGKVNTSPISTDVQIPITSLAHNSSTDYYTVDSSAKGVKILKAGNYLVQISMGANPATAGDMMGLSLKNSAGNTVIGPHYTRVGGNYDELVSPLRLVTNVTANTVWRLYARNNSAARGTVTVAKLIIVKVS